MSITWFQREVSLDDTQGRDGSRSLEARLVDPAAENPEQRMYRKELTDLVRKALANLNERERHIIRSRFGILGGHVRTLEQIAAGLNLSRERVRQLERIAKTKLRRDLICCSPHPMLAEG
jgi:RNA polymerase sigma factor (sigma-70 family)